jgi:hypothetical protein
MLRKSQNQAKITHTPYADFDELTRVKYIPPSNPSRISTVIETAGEIVDMPDGRKKFIAPTNNLYPATGGNARVTSARVHMVEFPRTRDKSLFQRWLQERVTRGQYVTIRQSGLDEPEGSVIPNQRFLEELWPDEDGVYYYSKAWPWSERSLKLYDMYGTLVYEYVGSGNNSNTYGVEVDGRFGRISTGTSKPAGGSFLAAYHRIIVGHVTDVQFAPLPSGEWSDFVPSMTIQETDWPAADKLYRLHLSNTAATVNGLTASTASSQPPAGQRTPTLYSLVKTPPGLTSLTYTASGNQDRAYDLVSVFVSDPLVEQILSPGLKCSVVAHWKHTAADKLRPATFIYLWRPGIGIVACLSGPSIWDRGLVDGDIEATADPTRKFIPVICTATTEPIDIFTGDRIVTELWSYEEFTTGQTAWTSGGDGNYNYPPGAEIAAPDLTWWVEFSDPIYVRKV